MRSVAVDLDGARELGFQAGVGVEAGVRVGVGPDQGALGVGAQVVRGDEVQVVTLDIGAVGGVGAVVIKVGVALGVVVEQLGHVGEGSGIGGEVGLDALEQGGLVERDLDVAEGELDVGRALGDRRVGG